MPVGRVLQFHDGRREHVILFPEVNELLEVAPRIGLALQFANVRAKQLWSGVDVAGQTRVDAAILRHGGAESRRRFHVVPSLRLMCRALGPQNAGAASAAPGVEWGLSGSAMSPPRATP